MAKALIEPVAGILRVLPNDGQYGDKFIWSCTVRWINRQEIELCAYMTEIKPSIYRAIFRECQKLGIRRILGVNYPEGATGPRKERWFDVPVPATPAQRYYNAEGAE